MKRILSLLLLTALLLPALVSCHGEVDRAEFVLPDRFDLSRDYEISFWAKNDTNATQVAIYEKAIEDFQALYPNIKVNLRLYTDYGKIYNDVITNLATGTVPNVCITYPDHIATYMTGQDAVVPLSALMDHPHYGLGGDELRYSAPTEEEMIPRFLSEGYQKGDYYSLPFMRSTEICYVNKTYVEKLGYTLPETLTWDFVWEVSRAATKKDAQGNFEINGQKVMLPFLYKSTDNMMITYLKQMGAGYSNDRGEILLFQNTTRDLLKKVAEETASGAFSTFKTSGYPANYLNAGQCIFAIDSSAGATWMGSDAPLVDIPEENMVDFETEVMLIPQIDPENPSMISQGPSLCIFNRGDAQEVLASWLFTQFLLTDDVQIAYSQTEGYLPVTQSAWENPEYVDYLSREGENNELYYEVKLQAVKLFRENLDSGFVTAVFNGSASLRDAAGHLLESTVKSVRRKETVDDAYFDRLYGETEKLYHLDQITSGGGRVQLGPLPTEAKILLLSLGGVWLILGISAGIAKKKKGSSREKT